METQRTKKTTYSCFFICCFVFSIFSVFSQTRYYVNTSGTPTGNALSWATACNDLQQVINNASNGDTIWVAQGVYIPIRPADSLWKIDPSDRMCAFVVTKNLHLYGGFMGFETDVNQRNLPEQGSGEITIISGDVGIQGDSSDNLPVLFIAFGADSVSVNGFTFKHSGRSTPNDRNLIINNKLISLSIPGAAMGNNTAVYNSCPVFRLIHNTFCNNIPQRILVSDSSTLLYISKSIFHNNYPNNGILILSSTNSLYIDHTTVSDNGDFNRNISFPNITDLIFSDADFVSITDVCIKGNEARHKLHLSTNVSQLTNVNFINNTGLGGVGGIEVSSSNKNTQQHVWTNLSFENNTGVYGGGIIFDNDKSDTIIAQMTNIRIINNTVAYGGGIYFSSGNLFIQLNNVTIANNTGTYGGGILLGSSENGAGTGHIQIRNSIISGNKGNIFYDSTDISIYRSRGTQYALSFSNCLVEGWKGTAGVILDTFPMFIDTANGDFHLLPNSPAVNAGNKLIYSPDSIADISWVTVDLDSLPRICDGEIDLGCYEVPGNILPYLFLLHSLRICTGDTAVIPLYLLGTPPWNVVYRTNKSQHYDTIKNITSSPYYFHVNPLNTTIYTFVSLSDSLYNTSFSDSVTVSVLKRPVINMEDSVFLCNSDTVTIRPAVTYPDHYLWNTGNTEKDISVFEAGIYRLTVFNEVCSVEDSVIAIQVDFGDFQLLTDGDLCNDGEIELSTNKEDVDYLWSTGETSSTSSTIRTKEDGVYRIEVFRGNCHGEDSLVIYCPCKVTLYNFFTPNDDGFNDIYLPDVESTLNSFSMYIYNRWGEVVFQTDIYAGWNGLANGIPAHDGVYYCVVYYTCRNNPQKILTAHSSITLAR
ncbi:MAG: gliding motility-associated C-terminal domain-containing protein [Bacteroidales bacterium]|jgi:gliding motility-associated-like protein|nr:gliding motility-associated C-terminal domain-containing protein [Bacteroidales bacterium]